MKRARFVALGAVVLAGLAGTLALSDRETGPGLAQAQSKATDLVSRGEYLARAGDCVACHTVGGGQLFAGGLPMPTPFGTLYTPNITPHPDTGIGKWTADDFWRALHEGKSKDGSLLYPAFPFTSYTKVTRVDADAIFAYLKSLPPILQPNRPHELRFPYNQRNLLTGWRALYFESGEYKPDSKRSAEWNRGAYLTQGLGHCDACHTSRNPLGATNKDKEFAGGLIPIQNWYAPSLTANRETGLGQWHIDDVVALLRTGASKRGSVYGPMSEVVQNSLQYLSDSDVRAMAVYLKSLVQESAPSDPIQVRTTDEQSKTLYEAGAKVYEKQCASCHMSNGTGNPPAYPPLANNQSTAMDFKVNPVRMVLQGGFPPSTIGNPRPFGMPPFAQALSDQEVAAVVTYIRQSWGNRGSAVSPAEVTQYRSISSE